MRNATCTLALAIILNVAAVARAAEPEKLSLDVAGARREAIVYRPSVKPKANGAPLVLAFHGHGGTMQSAARTMRYQTVWPEAIVVYGQGLNTPTKVDPEGKRPGWQRSLGDQKDRDLQFVDAILAVVSKKNSVDKNRIYATGFSNGAVFTYLLWAERPKVFAAFAPCAGLPLPEVHVKVPKPAFIVAGEKDPLVKIGSQRAMIEEVRKLDGATGAGKSTEGATVYKSDHDTPVETLIHPGGHVLPPDAPKLIAEFFRAHELKK